jgi:hypothetical protein
MIITTDIANDLATIDNLVRHIEYDRAHPPTGGDQLTPLFEILGIRTYKVEKLRGFLTAQNAEVRLYAVSKWDALGLANI